MSSSRSRIGILLVLMAVPLSSVAQPDCLDDVVEAGVAVRASNIALMELHFSKPLAKALPPERLGSVLDSFAQQHGTVDEISDPDWKQVSSDGREIDDVYVIATYHDKSREEFHFSCHGREIAGFHIRPAPSNNLIRPSGPGVVASTLRVMAIPYDIDAYVDVPVAERKDAIFIVVPGSGPVDADGDVGDRHVYADIANGLAGRGFTVVRFNKRTVVHPEFFIAHPGSTVRDELDDDLTTLVKFSKFSPELGGRKIYLLGHSLGAEAALRVASNNLGISGVLVFCGRSVPVSNLLSAQLVSFGSELTESERADFVTRIDSLRALEAGQPVTGPMPFGMTTAYMKDWISVSPTALASRLPIPVLVMLGTDDKNVDHENIGPWQASLAGLPRKQLEVVDGMDHFGSIIADGPTGVSPRVIRLIGAWADSL